MSTETISTRRSFLKFGALIAAPMAAPAAAAAMSTDDDLARRLARHEDHAAIRDLHQSWLRQLNAGTGDRAALLLSEARHETFNEDVRGIAADHEGEAEAIEVAEDGLRAEARFPCVVELEAELPRDNTLAQMAHAQGNGLSRRSERRLLKAEYVKADNAWRMSRIELAQA